MFLRRIALFLPRTVITTGVTTGRTIDEAVGT